jgi:pimeloyl-ACP methyl ester carboxylesterase
MARFVLVHGAFAGGWIWAPLAQALEALGHSVEAPDLPGAGDDPTPVAEVTLDAYAERLCEVVARRPEPAVVVASSMGGVAATQAAACCGERIARLIYVAAFLPRDGQSLIDLTRLPEGRGDQTQANLVVEGDPPVAFVPDDITRRTALACCSDEVAAWALERRRPQALAPFTHQVHLDGFDFAELRLSYVVCRQDTSIPPALQRRMLDTAGVTDVEELDTDHVPHLSMTAELAQLLDRRAR